MAIPKTIIHVVYSMGLGGIEQSAAKLAVDQIRRGCHVTVVCLYNNGQTGEELKAKGIEVIPLNLSKGMGMFNLIRPLYKICKDKKIDVMHVHTEGVEIPVSIVKILCKIKKIICTRRSFVHYRGARYILARIGAKFAEKFYNHLVCISNPLKQHLISHLKVTPGKIEVIWNGIDTEKFFPKLLAKPRNNCLGLNGSLSEDTFVIGMGVQLKSFKDIPTAIRAAKVIHEQLGTKVLFVVAGAGPLGKDLKKMVSDFNITETFKLVGAVDNMPEFINVLDVLLLTSPFEGLGMIVIEAMACGKPVITTDCGGVRDSVIDGETGFIVPVGNDQAIANAIIKLYEDRVLAEKMGQLGLKRARDNFSLEKYTQAHWNLVIN
jgi:glycosyltransferase involved in cell wall biosynthesis